jgi:hypothetical protein
MSKEKCDGEAIMIDMPGLKNIKPMTENSPSESVWKIETFTNLKSKEVIQFSRAQVKNTVLEAPLVFFRGRAFIRFAPEKGGQEPQAQPVVFDLKDEPTLEGCFDNFDKHLDEHMEKMKQAMENQSRIVQAKGMPNLRLRK